MGIIQSWLHPAYSDIRGVRGVMRGIRGVIRGVRGEMRGGFGVIRGGFGDILGGIASDIVYSFSIPNSA
jgi:hypothetical protein